MEHATTILELFVALASLIPVMIGLATKPIECRKSVVLSCCPELCDTPRVICASQCCHRRRADAVPAHVHLLGFCERFAVGAMADDVVAGEALGLVELSGLQHPQADIDDYIRRAFDCHRDECQAVAGGDGGCRLVGVTHILRAVVADQEGCYS